MNGVDKKEECGDSTKKLEIADDVAYNVSAWGYRHQQCLLLLIALMVAYSMRACMGIALVGMIQRNSTIEIVDDNHTQLNTSENVDGYNKENEIEENYNMNEDDYEAAGFLNALMLTPPYPLFGWDKKSQDAVISAFFFGYMLLQIPAGQLAHRFGAKTLMIGAMMVNCVVSLLFPLLTFYGGWKIAAMFRVIQGLSQACIMPSIHTFLGKWTPLEERGRLASIVLGGQALGTVLGLPITGFIAASTLGWPGIFRFYGMLSGITTGLLWWLLADSPAKHKRISVAERIYIQEALGQTNQTQKHIPVPWSRLLRSRGLYAIIVSHIGHTWGQLTLYSEVPAYMDKVMGVNMKANGLLTALPFMVMWFTNFFFSWFFDMLIVKKYLSVTWARKISNSVGSVTPSIGLIFLAYAPKNIYVVESILILICGFKIASHVGFMINHIDISPNFSGTMMSLSNFTSNSFGFLAPLVAGYILTDDDRSQYLWRKVFFVSSGLYFFSNLFYVLFGTCELADWNDPEIKETTDKDHEADPMLARKDDVKKVPIEN